ncbi:ATP-binding protein [Chondrinema litorale]|uniref:ATP-binding protein n=1 Tax=Chondrinema litorale TaxID=2994555 RepID=UPI002542DD55|nr:ATP-binding protein [Chondrinema litorale]UZR96402.1 ATP-binding protein [Chondrinema litorale]
MIKWNKNLDVTFNRPLNYFEDSKHNFWIVDENGIIKMDMSTGKHQLFQVNPVYNRFKKINALQKSTFVNDSLIFTTQLGTGLTIFNTNTQKYEHHLYLKKNKPTSKRKGKEKVTFRFCPEDIYKNYYVANNYFENQYIIYYDRLEGKIWSLAYIITQDEWLFLTFDINTQTFEKIEIENGFNRHGFPFDGGFLQKTLVQNTSRYSYTEVIQDESYNVWWGTEEGVFKISPQSRAFRKLNHFSTETHTSSVTDRNGNIWFSVRDTLYQYFSNNDSIVPFLFNNDVLPADQHSDQYSILVPIEIYENNTDTLWLPANDGLFSFNTVTKKFNRVDITDWPKTMVKDEDYNQRYYIVSCHSATQDKNGDFWLSYFGRLVNWQVKENKAYSIVFPRWTWSKDDGSPTGQINIDPYGKVWLGTLHSGLHVFDPKDITDPMNVPMDIFKTFEFEGADPKFIDSKNNMWVISASSGVIRINTKTLEYTQFTKNDGLADNTTYNIVENKNGNIWIGTANGLSCFNPEAEQFKNFYKSYGLPTNKVNAKFSSITDDGQLFIPTTSGIIVFNPDNVYSSSLVPRIVFTNFKVDGKELTISKDSPLKSDISLTKEIILPYWQNDLSISFSALHYDDTQKNQYEVFMENDDEDWRNIGNQHAVEYTNMSPGSYIFNVRASNSDGVWNMNGAKLQITILPPWWATWWAYTIYFILIAGLLYTFYKYKINQKLQLAEARRLQELDSFKTQFYTNITHEFRTPLTIILGLAKDAIIKRNASSLLQLINQILDISKIESGSLKVNLSQSNIIIFLKYLAESFYSLAEKQQVTIHFISDLQEVMMDYDKDKIQHIITNLLSNAVKFTPKGGNIYLTVDQISVGNQAYLQIKVKDTGIGISEDKLKHIFDRFYQADETLQKNETGTGLGLAVSKELVLLLNGKIEATSELGTGTEITIQLPITQTANFIEESNENAVSQETRLAETEEMPHEDSDLHYHSNMPQILIVEDSEDVIYYLKSCLKYDYKIETAANGQEGINKAKVIVPDIIISDVMMPVKDGYMLCEELKSDILTSHIPIILLTAKVMLENKIEGLDVGADAYLTKPFDKIELKACIKNLMKQRERLWKNYKASNIKDVSVKGMSIQDQKFLEKAHKILEEYKSDSDFNGEKLLRELGVSRTFLHVKLKSLTGKSTTEFIRIYRLKYAAELIKNGYGNLTEISIETGFANQSYFSKAFKDYYGVSPSAFAKEKN